MDVLGLDPVHGRTLAVEEIARFEDWADDVLLPSQHFVLFLAADARGVPDETLRAFAAKVLAQGMVYLLAWGPDCQRVHDVFDEVGNEREERGEVKPTDDAFVVTAWLDDSLDEALWDSLYATLPAENFIETWRATVAVVVGHGDWAQQIRERFANPAMLDVLTSSSPSALRSVPRISLRGVRAWLRMRGARARLRRPT